MNERPKRVPAGGAPGRVKPRLDDQAIRTAIDDAKLPGMPDRDVLIAGIKCAIRNYWSQQGRQFHLIKREVESLLALASRVADGEQRYAPALWEAVDSLSTHTRTLIEKRAATGQWPRYLAGTPPIPTQGELLNSNTMTAASRRLKLLLKFGDTHVTPEEAWSEVTYPVLYAPEVGPGRPPYETERDLVADLAVAYTSAIGNTPSISANRYKPGPFVRLVKQVLTLADARHVDATKLINTFGTLVPKKEICLPRRRLRRRSPLRDIFG